MALSGLLPYLELIAYARTDAIDPQHLDWWTPVGDGVSALKIVCLDENPNAPPLEYPEIGHYDVLFVTYRDGVDQIRGTANITG